MSTNKCTKIASAFWCNTHRYICKNWIQSACCYKKLTRTSKFPVLPTTTLWLNIFYSIVQFILLCRYVCIKFLMYLACCVLNWTVLLFCFIVVLHHFDGLCNDGCEWTYSRYIIRAAMFIVIEKASVSVCIKATELTAEHRKHGRVNSWTNNAQRLQILVVERTPFMLLRGQTTFY